MGRKSRAGIMLDITAIGIPLMMMFFSVRVSAQDNYTVGDNRDGLQGSDHTAFLYAPAYWEAAAGEVEYLNHVCTDIDGTMGQLYTEDSWCMEIFEPDPDPWDCLLPRFYEIIKDSTDLATLLFSTHGNSYGQFLVETYAGTQEGLDARDDMFVYYMIQGYENIVTIVGADGAFYGISVTQSFIRDYGHIPQALVYTNACYGYLLNNDFVDGANARVAMGYNDELYPSQMTPIVSTFFSRMDGKHGSHNRPVSAAKTGFEAILPVYGSQNTTLAPAVRYIVAPDTLHVGDSFQIFLDTKCDTWDIPRVYGTWCDVDGEEWVDSTTIRAYISEGPLPGIESDDFTLDCFSVLSARNLAYLDGNTVPEGGSNAEGPAHDDYVWRSPVKAPPERGDINLNGIPNEIGDAVLYTNYFIHGPDIWGYPEQEFYDRVDQGDVNNDGIPLTVADLVYMMRIITGEADPFEKIASPELHATLTWRIENGALAVDWRSEADAGALFLVFEHQGAEFGKAVLGSRTEKLRVVSAEDEKQLRVLIYGMESGSRVCAGEGTLLTIPLPAGSANLSLTHVEAAGYYGRPINVQVSAAPPIPEHFILYQNTPNPFNAATRIDFELPEAGIVNLKVYNILGRRVATLVDEYLEPGVHHVYWSGLDQKGDQTASGIYFYRIETATGTGSRKMVLLE